MFLDSVMNQLYLLCKPYLISYQDYIDRLDNVNHIQRSIPISDDENIQRGKSAMRYVLNNQKDVTHAMYRHDLGWIDFVWGDVGKPPTASGKRKGANGIAHILEARQRKDGLTAMQARALILKLVEVIAKGKVIRTNIVKGHENKVISYASYEATLVKDNKNEWLLSGWEVI